MGAMWKKRHMVYYVSAHGYGHGVRASDLIGGLLAVAPELRLTVISDLPEDFFRSRLPAADGRVAFAPGAFDVGMVQRDSIRVDVAATLAQAERLLAQHDELVAQEVARLGAAKADLVVADIPGIPLAAAAQAGVPGVAVGNFSWDWIYAPFAAQNPRWEPIIRMFADDYRQARLLLKLPFSPAMEVFARQTPVPLLARPGRNRRAELAAAVGAAPDKKWVLLSFTTLGWDADALRAVGGLAEYEFFTVKPLAWRGQPNLHAVDRHAFSFSDVLASVDFVITKPGYGILSDCVANRKPIIYAEREDFIEYPLLVQELRRYLAHVHIPAADLYAGHLAAALRAAETAPPPPEQLAFGGARVAAELLLNVG